MYTPHAATWKYAKRACRKLNNEHFEYDLASIHNDLENEFLVSLINYEDHDLGGKHYNYPWIGLHNKHESGWEKAEWADGSHFNFINWRTENSTFHKVVVLNLQLSTKFFI